ncbi:MAG TPA: alpha/beta hydrolase [Porphyromonadaceae bacterium]|nr:alpha/beta hydrolase [Porphyromonadaceae bacterium]
MEKSIQIDGVNINYDECGPEGGAPIILMHGWGCRLETLASIRAILADKMHVYSIDLPGHGKSDEPPAIWGVEEYTQLVETFIKMLGIDNPILLGHSFGGRISILLSSRNRVKKVLLVDAAGIKPHRSMKYYFKVYTYKAFKHLVRLFAGKKRGEKILEKRRRKSGSADYAAASPTMRGILSKCVNEDLKHVMPDIKAPTLLIWGENDTATPLSDARTMERLIPDAGLVSFPGCGHYSFLDNQRGFRAVIKEFLKDELQ